jgi:guanylate kinase
VNPFLLILSAPTGAGKTTIARALADARPDSVAFSVSATTRPPRAGERGGREYFFLSREEFEQRRAAGAFLEWAEYSGNLYGTLAAEVDRILESGRHVLLDIEVEGARQIRRSRRDVVSIFILPPSAQTLLDRIEARERIPPADLRRRLERAVRELEAADEYDYIVLNDDRDTAIGMVSGILDAESVRGERVEAAQHLRDQLRAIAAGMGG